MRTSYWGGKNTSGISLGSHPRSTYWETADPGHAGVGFFLVPRMECIQYRQLLLHPRPCSIQTSFSLSLSLSLALRSVRLLCNDARISARTRLLSYICRGLQHVQGILLGVEFAEVEPEGNAAGGREHRHDAVVPHQQGVLRQGDETLGDGAGEGSHEQVDGHDEAAHVVWGLGECVFERGDGCHDFREADQHVRHGLHPHIDRGWARAVRISGVVAAGREPVDVHLNDARGDHGHTGQREPKSDTLDRCKVDAGLAERWVNDEVHQWDKDDDTDGIEVLDNVVGDAVQFQDAVKVVR